MVHTFRFLLFISFLLFNSYSLKIFQLSSLSSSLISTSKSTTILGAALNEKLNDITTCNKSNLISDNDINNNPVALSTYLRKAVLKLIGKFTSDDGKYVNYSDMKISPEFASFVEYSQILPTFSLERLMLLSNEQKMSFFINLYNVLILHANCIIGFPDNNPESRTNFFRGITGAIYNIGGYNFSPDDIEHGILRSNKYHPSGGQQHGTYFDVNDLRGKLALPKLDPRIHFILNCGATSCPPIRVCGDDPEKVLKSAAVSYLTSQEIKIDFSCRTLSMPKLLFWYGEDFGKNIKERLQTILTMIPEENSVDIKKVLEDDPESYSVIYDNYDWSNNDIK